VIRLRFIVATTAALLILAACGSSARAIVLHDDDEIPQAQRPHDNVVGAWSANASCVVIGPSMVLTTTHQNTLSTVAIGGVTYTATVPAGFVGGSAGTADIRIAELSLNGEPADLGYWVDPYTDNATGETVVLGGYGKGRGSTLTTAGGDPYGYGWTGANTTLRWGRNVVTQQVPGTIRAGFDGPGAGDAVDYEAAAALYDSGGGWFIEEGGNWYVAGLTTGAEHASLFQSWFATSTTAAPDPDRLEAVRVQSHASWIADKMALTMPTPGDADRDGDVDYDDLVLLASGYGAMADAGWSLGNFDGDGDVDLVDLGIMAEYYGAGAAAGLNFTDDLRTVTLVPEPASLTLVLFGAAFALRRRRH